MIENDLADCGVQDRLWIRVISREGHRHTEPILVIEFIVRAEKHVIDCAQHVHIFGVDQNVGFDKGIDDDDSEQEQCQDRAHVRLDICFSSIQLELR